MQTIVLFQAVGVSLLFYMGLAPAMWSRLWIILPVFVLRTAANNSCYAITRSLLMDYVPKVRCITRSTWQLLRLSSS